MPNGNSPRIKSVYFGRTPIDGAPNNAAAGPNGNLAGCAINTGNTIVEVHTEYQQNRLDVYAGVRTLNGITVLDAQPPVRVTEGQSPSVAINSQNVCVIVNELNGNLKYSAGTVRRGAVEFLITGADFGMRNGANHRPSVAMTEDGYVIEVHESTAQGGVVYRQGILNTENENVQWENKETVLDPTGSRPSVAVNNVGDAVFVWESGGNIIISSRQIRSRKLAPGARYTAAFGPGVQPTVAVTDERWVYTLFARAGALYQRTLQIDQATGAIVPQDVLGTGTAAALYDDAVDHELVLGDGGFFEPHIAGNGSFAVQVFGGGDAFARDLGATNPPGLRTFYRFTSACMTIDRPNWMGDNRAALITKTLRTITIPGSHDAGAFADDTAQTQDLTIAGQLAYGVRYFDIRPRYTGSNSNPDLQQVFTYHDIGLNPTYYLGPKLADVIAQVRSFMNTHRELVILKISHYSQFQQNIFNTLANALTDQTNGLGPWLYKPGDVSEAEKSNRLADRKLSEFLKEDGGRVLILADVNGSTDYVQSTQHDNGILRYRDWYASDPSAGDVTVFDVYGATDDFSEMAYSQEADNTYSDLRRGQLPKFINFTGLCRDGQTQCDLFLNSWTITPQPAAANDTAFFDSDPASRELVADQGQTGFHGVYKNVRLDFDNGTFQNSSGRSVNILYTDAVEFTRSVDVSIVRSQLVAAAQPNATTPTAAMAGSPAGA
jgi:hypothetical protein